MTTKSRRPGRKTSTKEIDIREIRDSYEQTLAIVDAAVTGALIGGVAPLSFQATLSYWFLHCACGSRSKSAADFEKWTLDLALVWEPVLCAIYKFACDFEGDIDDCGEVQELDYLRNSCGIKSMGLSEFDEHRHSKKAVQLTEWLMNTLGADEKRLTLSVELSFLVTWFKIAALINDADEDVYMTVRQYVPLVFKAYNEVLLNV